MKKQLDIAQRTCYTYEAFFESYCKDTKICEVETKISLAAARDGKVVCASIQSTRMNAKKWSDDDYNVSFPDFKTVQEVQYAKDNCKFSSNVSGIFYWLKTDDP